ncbi:hypothetical protein VitviT2T_007553 [Vitis vinifera]|uniref:DNA-directed RNA polymerases II, IV and V subunit 8B n=2 Tax=Vitis vinifera TaxID=29760 RepID=A0ABY9BZH3_VITVI|nr:hypothetical protein VitviT2T_007553 [Vitis vinifera]
MGEYLLPRDNFAVTMVETFFDDIFVVDGQDPGGKKFDKVSRIEASSEQYDMFMQLDVNIEAYPIQAGEKFRMVLAPTLHLDGADVTDYFTQGEQKSLADKFDYVMYGIIYKVSNEGSGPDVKGVIYASFGGLLMILKGDPSNLNKLEVNKRLFLLMKKVLLI